jgi:hypothetical protein
LHRVQCYEDELYVDQRDLSFWIETDNMDTGIFGFLQTDHSSVHEQH